MGDVKVSEWGERFNALRAEGVEFCQTCLTTEPEDWVSLYEPYLDDDSSFGETPRSFCGIPCLVVYASQLLEVGSFPDDVPHPEGGYVSDTRRMLQEVIERLEHHRTDHGWYWDHEHEEATP